MANWFSFFFDDILSPIFDRLGDFVIETPNGSPVSVLAILVSFLAVSMFLSIFLKR